LSATYSATGNMEQPTISANPLSMLAPGIFRRIFEGHIPTGRTRLPMRPRHRQRQSLKRRPSRKLPRRRPGHRFSDGG